MFFNTFVNQRFIKMFKKKCVNQRCLLFESGCKGKNFISYLPNVSGSFFHSAFSKGNIQKETSPKQKK